MSDDLIERLRARADMHVAATPAMMLREAAARIRELEAESAALRGMKVNPLAWGPHGDGLKVKCQIGEYHVHPTANTRNNKHVVYLICAKRKSWTVGYNDGEEAAKAAAQADYERRIMSALSPAPVSVGEAARIILDNPKDLTSLAICLKDEHQRTLGTGHGGYLPSLRTALRALLETEGE